MIREETTKKLIITGKLWGIAIMSGNLHILYEPQTAFNSTKRLKKEEEKSEEDVILTQSC